MKKLVLSTVLSILVTTLSIAQTINSVKSQVKFEVSNMKFKTVDGTFGGMKGNVRFTENDLNNSTFDVCIDAATVNTDLKKRDEHLRNTDFFEVAKYPTICFKSSVITKTAKGYQVKGMLTMHGISKEVQIPFTYSGNTFTGTFILNRFDYKVGEDTGTFMVGDEVTITIICILN